MATNAGPLIPHVVVDSAAFIKRARLETFGTELYTCPEVTAEIRDAHTREFLKCLPYTVHMEIPSKESINFVRAIAKNTGDISVLSNTDISVIALTYELYKRFVGEPEPKPIIPIPSDLGQQAQYHEEEKGEPEDGESGTESEDDVESKSSRSSDLPAENEWITEDNFETRALDNFGLGTNWKDDTEAINKPPPIVACLTTDFAMQNVLFHAGIPIISLEGRLISQPRTNLLWCGSCFRPTKRSDTYFCPSCAQPNLRRIPVTLHEDGRLEFHFSRHFKKRLRGLKQPVTKPKGGKYADDPIYCPDQRLPDRRPARPKHPKVQLVATNGLLELENIELTTIIDGIAAFPLQDVTSRSSRKGIRSDHQIPSRSLHHPMAEHGLKPTRGAAQYSKQRTGNKKKKRSH
ncbi:unnamed protein product [Calicophoron daubneyi]|uniref:RNA-binding protein NOB1 n=1 Tax=Calicophoron daubneyi TaxID=300641 RepID=A0AAV2TDI4_CALDB